MNPNCSNHGVYVPLTDACSCDRGYYFEDCSANATACAQILCKGNGLCTSSTSCVCTRTNYNPDINCADCVPGFSNATNCTACITGIYGPFCNLNASACRDFYCAGHGDCLANGFCLCDYAWRGPRGPFCTVPSCENGGTFGPGQTVCRCPFLYTGPRCTDFVYLFAGLAIGFLTLGVATVAWYAMQYRAPRGRGKGGYQPVATTELARR